MAWVAPIESFQDLKYVREHAHVRVLIEISNIGKSTQFPLSCQTKILIVWWSNI